MKKTFKLIILLIIFVITCTLSVSAYYYEPCVSSYGYFTDFYEDEEFSCHVSKTVDWYEEAYIAPNVGSDIEDLSCLATLQNDEVSTSFNTYNGYNKYVYASARLEDDEIMDDEKFGSVANLKASESWLTWFHADVVSGVHQATVRCEDTDIDTALPYRCEGQHFFARMPN